MGLTIDVAVECERWTALPEFESLAKSVVDACIQTCGARAPDEAELSLLLCDDATIRALNQRWRGHDKPTNVLSFSAMADRPLAERRVLGDIALAFETAQREAREQSKPFERHVAHLLAHGFLHLLGFDHATAPDAEMMEEIERRALARLGVPDPYDGQDLELS